MPSFLIQPETQTIPSTLVSPSFDCSPLTPLSSLALLLQRNTPPRLDHPISYTALLCIYFCHRHTLSLLLLFVNQSRQRVSINYNKLSTTHTPSHYTRSFQSTFRTTPSQLRPLLYKRNYLSTTANKTFEMLANGLTFLTALLPLLSVADAAHAAPKHHRRHHALASRDEPSPRGIAQVAPRANAGHAEAKRTIKRAVKKRGAQQQCRVRGSTPPTPSSAAASAVSSVAAESAAPSPAASSSAAAAETPSIPNQNAWADQVCLTSTVLHQLTV